MKGNSFLWYLVHHFVRVIWANLLGIVFNIFYLFKQQIKNDLKTKYTNNYNHYKGIKTLSELQDFYRNTYIYKWDGDFSKYNSKLTFLNGLVDHNNFKREFFSVFGDCDDLGRWSAKALKNIEEVANIIPIGMYSASENQGLFWHYDCYFEKQGKSYLFNYGNLIEGQDIKDCIKRLLINYKRNIAWDTLDAVNFKWWPCYWF